MRLRVFRHRMLEACLALSVAAAFALAVVPPTEAVECVTDAPDLLYQNDGDVGLYLKRVGGPVLAGINESTVFEPASALKVLIHTHALRQVQDGLITLSTQIDWTRDLNEDICGSHPCNVQNPQAEQDSLGLLLNQMMVCSDNRHTDALRDFFTNDALFETADILGLTDTEWNHDIGCPTCGNLNELTLVDLGRIYEGVAAGYLDEEHQQLFHDLMINETFGGGFDTAVDNIVDQEVAKAGLDPQVATDFKDLIRWSSKGGSYTLFNCNSDPGDSLWRSLGGVIELPVNNGNGTCEYVFGAWMNLIPTVVQGTGTISAELLRLAVCEALSTWDMLDVDEITSDYTPPNPWAQEGILIDYVNLVAGTDLTNVRFFSDPLQCENAPCETDHPKKIHHDMVEFVPAQIGYLAAGDTVEVEIKRTIPMGRAACHYTGKIHMIADADGLCIPTVSEKIDVDFNVNPLVDMDIDNNGGSLSNDVMYLVGAKGDFVQGTFVIVNPNTWDQNVDFEDGPGNVGIDSVEARLVGLSKVGDPFVNISDAVVITPIPEYLGSGESEEVSVQIFIPDDIPVNATYRGRVVVEYENCDGGSNDIDAFDIELLVLPTQGALNIVQTEIDGDFCPDDPWVMEGQVFLSFDVEAIGDHRNIRVASGGLRHETLDKKLDLFNFYPEEIAFLAAGETRTINVITKIPIGQHSGNYAEYFRVVSESGGEDSVLAEIDICELYDLDIRDDYANLGANVMEINTISKATMSGGEWALRAFDIGLPSGLVVNDDQHDGPGNTPVDCVECRFAEWSPLWHIDDPEHNFFSQFDFTGYGEVHGDSCGWMSGEFRRMFISVFVPPMTGGSNHPGTYKGRLLCAAIADGDTVAQDYFDIDLKLARIVGPPFEKPPEETNFAGEPIAEGAELSWGDFRAIGMSGGVNLYREDPETKEWVRLNGAPLPQPHRYVDEHDEAGLTYRYRIGVASDDREMLIGPISIGGNPVAFRLAQNAPNPFTDQTTISYDLARPGAVTLRVFDINGRLVRVLKDTEEPAGFYTVSWDLRDDAGRRSSAGIYFYRIETNGFSSTKKMVVLR